MKSSPDPSVANLVQLNAGDKFTFLEETVFSGDSKWYKTVYIGQWRVYQFRPCLFAV